MLRKFPAVEKIQQGNYQMLSKKQKNGRLDYFSILIHGPRLWPPQLCASCCYWNGTENAQSNSLVPPQPPRERFWSTIIAYSLKVNRKEKGGINIANWPIYNQFCDRLSTISQNGLLALLSTQFSDKTAVFWSTILIHHHCIFMEGQSERKRCDKNCKLTDLWPIWWQIINNFSKFNAANRVKQHDKVV